MRQTYHPINRSSKDKKTQFITKPVNFPERLLGKNITAKSNESMSAYAEKEIKMYYFDFFFGQKN